MATLTETADRAAEGLDNPYVGPRPFREGEPFFARQREALELLDLLIAERIVLLHSPSGAGKTSLIQAALIPALRAQRFNILPVIRVGRPLEAPAGPEGDRPDAGPEVEGSPNRFLLSAALSLGGEIGPTPPDGASLGAYLDRRPRPEGSRSADVLIFDQFEEILTVDPFDLKAKQEFFEQIGLLLDGPRRWALFSLREDYLAALDPYLGSIPTRLQTTFRLDLLDEEGAREAIEGPPRRAKRRRHFTAAAVDKLVEDLRRVQVQLRDGSLGTRAGPHVEPVQLQVVCERLWERLPDEVEEITEADVSAAGDVDEALRSYYARRVGAAASEAGVGELEIRRWIDRHLITPQGIRSQVLDGSDAARELPQQAIKSLIDAHLVRAEERGNRTWYELAHDRLVAPVRADNATWFEQHMSALQRAAARWAANDEAPGLLLRDQQLRDAERWLKEEHTGTLSNTEEAFLAECRQAQAAADKERRRRRTLQGLTAFSALVSIIAFVAFLFAQHQARIAQQVQEIATSRGLAAAALNNLNRDPELSILLALRAVDRGTTAEAVDALHRAVQASRAQRTFSPGRGAMADVAFSRDGRLLAAASGDLTVTLWETTSGQELARLVGHTQWANGVAFSPDGRLVATAGVDQTVRLWETASGQELFKLDRHTKPVNGVAFSSDGQFLASASGDGTVIVWEVLSGQLLHTLAGHTESVNAVAFGKDATQLASVGDDRTVRLWDAASGHADRTLTYPAALNDVAFSPEGDRLAVAGRDRSAGIWSLAAGSETAPRRMIAHTDWVQSVAFSPDGTRLATSGRDWKVKVWDANSLEERSTLSGHTDWVYSAAWGPDSRRLASASHDGTVRVWDTGLPREVLTLSGHEGWIASVTYNAEGGRLVSASVDGTAIVWDAASGQPLRTLSNPNPNREARALQAVAFDRDGKRLATIGQDGKPRVWDAGSGALLHELPGHCEAGLCVESNHLAFSPDGRRLATGARDFTAAVWDIESGQEVLPRLMHENWVYGVAFSPDGSLLATGSWDTKARLWDVSSGAVQRELSHPNEVNDVGFSPDGRHLATSTLDGKLYLWEVGSGELQRVMSGHSARIYSLAFNDDGTLLATASWDRTTRVWSAASGRELLTFPQADDVFDVAFRPGTSHLAATGSERLIHVYTLDLEELKSLARQRVTRDLTQDECERYLQLSRCS